MIVKLMTKIITNDYFEMKNFLPKLGQRDFWRFFDEEESRLFFDGKNAKIIQLILRDTLKKYFSGKRKLNVGKIRKRKRTTAFTLLFKQSNFTRNGFLKIYQQIQNDILFQNKIKPINKNKNQFFEVFKDGNDQNILNFRNFQYKNYTQKTAKKLFESPTFSRMFFKYLEFNIKQVFILLDHYIKQGLSQQEDLENHLKIEYFNQKRL